MTQRMHASPGITAASLPLSLSSFLLGNRLIGLDRSARFLRLEFSSRFKQFTTSSPAFACLHALGTFPMQGKTRMSAACRTPSPDMPEELPELMREDGTTP